MRVAVLGFRESSDLPQFSLRLASLAHDFMRLSEIIVFLKDNFSKILASCVYPPLIWGWFGGGLCTYAWRNANGEISLIE